MPTVTSGTVSIYQVPVSPQSMESDGTAEWDHTGVLIVELHGAGKSGLGYSYTDAAAAGRMAQGLLDSVVVGRSAWDIPAIHNALNVQTRNMGRPGLVSTAIAALDVALWDLKAKLLDVSLLDLLGATRREIAAYGSGGFTSYTETELLQQMTEWATIGLREMKMKVGRQPALDIARASAVTKALGKRADLFVDANGAYSRKQALHQAGHFADLGVTWFEEPVSSDDRAGLRLLVERAPVPLRIAAGEYNYMLDDARLLIEAGAVDVMQADATRCGGITNFLAIAALCEAHHLPLSAHTAPSLHAPLCCSAPAAINVEYFYDHVRIENLFFEGAAEAKAGVLQPDRSALGLGLNFKRQDAERFRHPG